MKKFYLVTSTLMLIASTAAAVDFNWAVIGNAGNDADDTGYGSVNYEYSIATTEVTTAQYVEFLNAVAATDTYGLYNEDMSSSEQYQGINRSGNSGYYTYTVNTGWENKPVVYVSWYDTLRFTNWLHNGQQSGTQDVTTTEYGAYDMTLQSTIVRLDGAACWLPSENEWYKAAYYAPESGVYYDYATGSNTAPDNNTPESDSGNSANYWVDDNGNGSREEDEYSYSTEVGAYTLSDSPYGTYDQSGNVWEWIEDYSGTIQRGGSFRTAYDALYASYRRDFALPANEGGAVGFRIASFYTNENETAIPEPMSIGLLLLSLCGLVLHRAKKS